MRSKFFILLHLLFINWIEFSKVRLRAGMKVNCFFEASSSSRIAVSDNLCDPFDIPLTVFSRYYKVFGAKRKKTSRCKYSDIFHSLWISQRRWMSEMLCNRIFSNHQSRRLVVYSWLIRQVREIRHAIYYVTLALTKAAAAEYLLLQIMGFSTKHDIFYSSAH